MGKSTKVDGDNNPAAAETDPAKLLEAALLQMDGIIAEAGGAVSSLGTITVRSSRTRALDLAQQLASCLQHCIPPPPRPDFTTASAILRWLQQNNNYAALAPFTSNMRELGRGGSIVAATIAALHNRAAGNEKPRAINSRAASVESRNLPRTIREGSEISEERSRRESCASERPLSTASEASERDSASVLSSEEPVPRYSGDSDSPDEATVKCVAWPEGVVPTRASSSDQTSSSSDESDRPDADYHTLTPSRRLDDSTRRDDDFKWMPTGEIVDEDVNENQPNSMETRAEDYSSASLDRRRRTPSDRGDRDRKTRSSLSSKPPQHPSVRASPRPRRHRQEPEEASPELQRRWNSYEHFRWPEGGGGPPPWWPPVCWCHGPPPPPPCCMHDRSWPSHPSLPPIPARTYKNDAEERVRRLEADKESLQLQVQVLSEQIAAQNEKMIDLERALHDTRQKLDDAEQRLQKEMLQRSSLETQKLELLSKLSEFRLRAVERNVLERSPPPDIGNLSNIIITSTPLSRPQPPRTPPANYGRQIERNNHFYSSLPRSSIVTSEARIAFGKHSMVVARGRGQSVPNLAEKEEARNSPSPSLRSRLGSGVKLEGDEFARSSLRTSSHASSPRQNLPWQTTDVRQWDSETTCGWLESLGLEVYVPAARTWLESAVDSKGVIAAASHQTIEKELSIKHPMHKKKIALALTDLLGGHGDALLTAAGPLDTTWVLRWLEDIGLCGARTAASEAALDGRCLHRLSHSELHTHLRVTFALHAISVRRGIQVLRDNKFNPETMIRRAVDGEGSLNASEAELARWSTHRVMQWLKEIDLAEYAPNLRGAGVHGGLMLLEPRFTAELLAALLNIPANKTLLRRHLTQRFNDLLGRDVIQQKRTAEQTLGYQSLTTATKYKVPKRGQFSLKRKKSKDDLYLSDLVCPLHDDGSGEIPTSPTMKIRSLDVGSGVCPPRDDARSH